MCRGKLLTVTYDNATISDHWSNAGVDIKYLTCHVTSRNQVMEELCNFMSGSSSLYLNTLPSLIDIGTEVVEICF